MPDLDRAAILRWLEDAAIAPKGREIILGLLADRGELRQRLQQAEKAIRTTAEDWSRKGMPMGRYFANYAAEMWCREAGELRQALGLNADAYAAALWRAEQRNRAEDAARKAARDA